MKMLIARIHWKNEPERLLICSRSSISIHRPVNMTLMASLRNIMNNYDPKLSLRQPVGCALWFAARIASNHLIKWRGVLGFSARQTSCQERRQWYQAKPGITSMKM